MLMYDSIPSKNHKIWLARYRGVLPVLNSLQPLIQDRFPDYQYISTIPDTSMMDERDAPDKKEWIWRDSEQEISLVFDGQASRMAESGLHVGFRPWLYVVARTPRESYRLDLPDNYFSVENDQEIMDMVLSLTGVLKICLQSGSTRSSGISIRGAFESLAAYLETEGFFKIYPDYLSQISKEDISASRLALGQENPSGPFNIMIKDSQGHTPTLHCSRVIQVPNLDWVYPLDEDYELYRRCLLQLVRMLAFNIKPFLKDVRWYS